MYGECVNVQKKQLRLLIINIAVFSNCIHCTVENCLQLLQILIVSLLKLHINIVGVVTCSDNSTRRLVTCII